MILIQFEVEPEILNLEGIKVNFAKNDVQFLEKENKSRGKIQPMWFHTYFQ